MSTKITVCEALKELKTLKDRIEKRTSQTSFTTTLIGGKLPVGFESKEKFEAKAIASLQSIKDLIVLRNEIKSAIVKSNAETSVMIGDERYTVAGAIERKTSIEYEQKLVKYLGIQLLNTLRAIENHNQKVNQSLDSHITTILGKDAKEKNGAEVEDFTVKYLAKNEAKIVDPINAKEEIDVLEKRIEDFMANVDTALSISNATTLIEVE
jgi:hypothetical protein